MTYKILVINPGATSTKIAMFKGNDMTFQESASHGASELKAFDSLADQIPYRKKLIFEILERGGIECGEFDAVVGRDGYLPLYEAAFTRCRRICSPTREK